MPDPKRKSPNLTLADLRIGLRFTVPDRLGLPFRIDAFCRPAGEGESHIWWSQGIAYTYCDKAQATHIHGDRPGRIGGLLSIRQVLKYGRKAPM